MALNFKDIDWKIYRKELKEAFKKVEDNLININETMIYICG